jgi:Holliday junction resolvase RusA-like endonuclease
MARLAQAGLVSLWVGGKPVPAGRPRVSKYGVYYPKTYTAWNKESWKDFDQLTGVPTDKPIALLIEVLCPTLKASKYTMPIGDVDNFIKGPMDQLTKTQRAWIDDRQVVALTVVKRFIEPDEEPGFQLHWCELEG